MTNHRIGRTVLLALVAAIAAMAIGTATASATFSAAKWQQSTSTMRWQGALTVDAATAAPKSCTSITVTGGATPGTSEWAISNAVYYIGGTPTTVLKLSCAGSTELVIKLDAFGPGTSPTAWYNSETGYELYGGFAPSGYVMQSPYGKYEQLFMSAPFINAGEKGSATSKVTFNETFIGNSVSNGALTLTGTITVDDGKGKPRTLTH